jgi:hypothetical protein
VEPVERAFGERAVTRHCACHGRIGDLKQDGHGTPGEQYRLARDIRDREGHVPQPKDQANFRVG